MSVMRRRFKKVGMSLVLIFILGGFLFLWILSGQILSPKRRDLVAYHDDFLNDASGHGITIETRSYCEGKVPLLVVRPDAAAGIAERGERLRSQLKEREIPLSEFGEENKVVVLLHGRTGRKEDLLPIAERFCAVGMICLLPDLPAHGESELEQVSYGSSEFERLLPGAVLREFRAETGCDFPALLWGMSMGGSFAIHSAFEEPELWERLVIVSSFDSLVGVLGDSWVGWFLPVIKKLVSWRGGLELEEVRPVDLAASLKVPTLLVHGDADDLIVLSRGQALYEAFAGEKKFVKVPGGTHSNVLVTEAPVFAEMAEWYLGAEAF